jgi:hypothetical protein
MYIYTYIGKGRGERDSSKQRQHTRHMDENWHVGVGSSLRSGDGINPTLHEGKEEDVLGAYIDK